MQDPFLPTDLESWVKTIGEIILIAGAVSGIVWGLLMRPINGLGGRVDNLEKDVARGNEARANMKDVVQRLDFERGRLHEDVGRLEKAIEGLTDELDRGRDSRNSINREMGERLARIEEKIDGDRELKVAMVEALNRSK